MKDFFEQTNREEDYEVLMNIDSGNKGSIEDKEMLFATLANADGCLEMALFAA